EDQAKALGVSPNQALSEAQEAGIEAAARGEQGTVDITNVPGTPTYVPPTEGKPVSYVIPEDQAKALGVSPNQALSEAQYKGLMTEYKQRYDAMLAAREVIKPYIKTVGERMDISGQGDALPGYKVYNFAQFLVDHPEDGEKLMRDAGYTEETIVQAIASRGLLPFYNKDDGTYNLVTYFRTMGVDIMSGEPDLDKIHKAEQRLKDSGFASEDIARSRLAAMSGASSSIGEGKAKPLGIIETSQQNLNGWAEGLREDALKKTEGYSPFASRLSQGVSGVAVGALTFIPASALFLAEALTHPTKIPSMAKDMVEGIKQSAMTVINPLAAPYDIAYNTFNLGMIAGGTVIGGIGAVGKITTWVSPRSMATSLIGKEVSTGRIPMGDIDPVALGKAMGEVQRRAMEPGGYKIMGDSIPIEGTAYKLNYLKTPVEGKIGNIVWHGTNEGLNALIKNNELIAGESGLYTDPWAAMQYTRGGGGKPGLVMIITDASKVRDVPIKTLENISQSAQFIEAEAKPGLYSPSKIWRGDFETEIVAAPGTKFFVPEPTSDLFTRIVAGKTSDFFTYDSGKYVPIKIAIDKSLIIDGKLPDLPTTADITSVKLLAFKNTLQNFTAAIKHPDLAIKDILRGVGAINPADVLRADLAPGKGISPPGVRDVYLVNSWGAKLKILAKDILDSVTKKAKEENLDNFTKEGRKRIEELYREEYNSRVAELITSSGLATQYYTSPEYRQVFEDLYIENLRVAVESEVRTQSEMVSSLDDVLSRVASEQSSEYISEVESRTTPREDRTDRGREGAREIPEEPREPVGESIEEPVEKRRVDEKPYEEPKEGTEPVVESRITEKTYDEGTDIKLFRDKEKEKTEDKELPPGTVVWIQGRPYGGAMYKYIVPPYREENMHTTRVNPKGYVDAGLSGEGSAFKSIQVVGGAPPSNIENVDLGFVRINISLEGGKPVISYAQDEDANAGERSTTIGMGEGQIPIDEWEQAKAQGKTKEELIKERGAPVVEENELPEVPSEEIAGIPVRIKKPKNIRNWWEEPQYENEPADMIGARYYRGKPLIPPNLGGNV
ncbi:MAG: hypothetical protein WC554_10185, partial [Clostridia bacterium]